MPLRFGALVYEGRTCEEFVRHWTPQATERASSASHSLGSKGNDWLRYSSGVVQNTTVPAHFARRIDISGEGWSTKLQIQEHNEVDKDAEAWNGSGLPAQVNIGTYSAAASTCQPGLVISTGELLCLKCCQ